MLREILTTITPEEIIKAAGAPIISYDEAERITGRILKKKSIQNRCSLGQGPRKIRIGRKVGFRTVDFAEWFCGQIKVV